MAAKYKPGDQVLPKINRRERTADERRADDDDRRLVDEVREISLREAGVSSSIPPRTRRRRDSRSGDDRNRSARDQSADGRQRRSHRPRGDSGSRQNSDQLYVEGDRRHRRSDSRQRRIEHQSSIRSLISSQDMSERDIEREIEDFARQIQEEGLLDGLDLDNIDLTRDDELSRRITEAYRRRQRERTRQETSRRNNNSGYNSSTRYTESVTADPRLLAPEGSSRPRSRTQHHSRSASATSQSDERTRPPTSISTANLEVQDSSRRSRRRTASDTRSATTPAFLTASELRAAAHSSTDLTLRSQTSDPTQSRPSFSEARSASTPAVSSPPPPLAPTSTASTASSNNSNLSFANRAPQGNPQHAPITASPTTNNPDPATGRMSRSHRPSELAIVHSSATSPMSSPLASSHQRTRSHLFPEPSINCSRCNKSHIEYELHYNCSICADGQWNICLDCYRTSKGCRYWFGFGYDAWRKWEEARKKSESTMGRPHMLTACRYIPPRTIPGGAEGRKTLTTDDPQNRMESGEFCVKCYAWTNDCFWRCYICNSGDWGFCNNCVNQGKSCPHKLLPLTHDTLQVPEVRSRLPRSPSRPPTATVLTGPNSSNIGPYKALTFSTRCDVCQDPISPSQARYHCYECTSSLVSDALPGDYDICSACYGTLVNRRQISPENGHSGWRRCLNGHRMVIVEFISSKEGQWRYVTRDLVGGHSLRFNPTSNTEHERQGLQKWTWHEGDQPKTRLVTQDVGGTAPTSDGATTFAQTFPLDGGVGRSGRARWAWYPQTGADNDLQFPRGAEIKEIEILDEEWYFGTYMGTQGVFPGPYVVLEQNS